MNVEKINEFKERIAKEIGEAIQNHKLDLSDLFSDKELAEKALNLELTLDLDLVRNEDFIKDEELRDSLRELPDSKLIARALCLCGRTQEVIPCFLLAEFNC